MTILEQAALHFDDAQSTLQERLKLARDQATRASDLAQLVGSESLLWQAYYDSRQFRIELKCDQNNVYIHEFETRMPSR